MARVDWNTEKDVDAMLRSLIAPGDAIGQRGKAAMQQHTPVRSGVLKASEHYVVLDPDGKQIGGDATDGNGNAVPRYAANGMLQVIVGTNEAAEVGGEGYADSANSGTRGRAGALFREHAEIEMERAVKDEIG